MNASEHTLATLLADVQGLPTADVWLEALDLVGEAVVVFDPDRRIRYFSRAAAELTGWQPEEVLGRLCTEGLSCLDCIRACTLFERGRVCQRRATLRTRDGQLLDVLKNGRVVRDAAGRVVLGIETLQDVGDLEDTRAELADAALKLEGERRLLMALAETVEDGVVILDRHGRLGRVSRRAAELLGTTPEQAAGAPIEELFLEASCLRESLARLLVEGGRLTLEGLRPVAAPGTALCLRLLALQDGAAPQGAVVALRADPASPGQRHGLVGRSPAHARLLAQIDAVAAGEAPVLVQGETGAGRSAVARAIHLAGPRADRPFVVVSGATQDAARLEAELFGVERGEGGARRARPGALERAGAGTLVLDGVAILPASIQARLSEVLEQGRFRRLGGRRPQVLRARVVALTRYDLDAQVRAGAFRPDLLYRLRVLSLAVPPLRTRREDVLPLARHFAEAHTRRLGRPTPAFSADALSALGGWSWPGNVRELENAVAHAVSLSDGAGPLRRSELPDAIAAAPGSATDDPDGRTAIVAALAEARYHRGRAAELLGISRTTLWRRMRELGLA